MKDELRDAAERCIDKMNQYGCLPGSVVDECETVLSAYLAATPPDNEDPLTEKWLKGDHAMSEPTTEKIIRNLASRGWDPEYDAPKKAAINWMRCQQSRIEELEEQLETGTVVVRCEGCDQHEDDVRTIVDQEERIRELEDELEAANYIHDNERENFHLTLNELEGFNGDGDLWAALIRERDSLKAENERNAELLNHYGEIHRIDDELNSQIMGDAYNDLEPDSHGWPGKDRLTTCLNALRLYHQKVDQLNAFKEFVHGWLDKACVPKFPNEKCRIRARLEWIARILGWRVGNDD